MLLLRSIRIARIHLPNTIEFNLRNHRVTIAHIFRVYMGVNVGVGVGVCVLYSCTHLLVKYTFVSCANDYENDEKINKYLYKINNGPAAAVGKT